MKKVQLTAFLFLGLVSCNSSSELIPDDTSGNIHGVWKLYAKYVEGSRQAVTECEVQEQYRLQGDSIFINTPIPGTNNTCNVEEKKGIFSITNNVLLYNVAQQDTHNRIKELTTTKLVLISEDLRTTTEYERQ